MRITLLGAAGEVTGSAYLIAAGSSQVLVDFGMFQGGADDDERNVVPDELDPRRLDAVVLTHGHIDHIGRLPLLAQAGFRGPIYGTPATLEIAALLLDDSARLQAGDAERASRRRQRAGLPPLQPPYGAGEVQATIAAFTALPYDRATVVAPDIAVTPFESGHILGSASLRVQVGAARVLFSGDIGPRAVPYLRDPAQITGAELVFLESTYGDRDHRPPAATVAEFAAAITDAIARGGKILIPAFAVGRAQQILYHLAELFRSGAVTPFPVYLDSPLAIKALDVYTRHPELADSEAAALLRSGQLQRAIGQVHICETSAESRALNALDGPCLIIAGSGMANGGRILHHLRHNLWRPETAVLIVGYQAAGTLGRQLVEGASTVRIFGDPIAVRAQIYTLGGFSAHAGQSELLEWLAPLAPSRPRLVLTHGEDRARHPLAALIAERYALTAELPRYGATVELGDEAAGPAGRAAEAAP